MHRMVILAVAALVALVVVLQVALPPVIERRVEGKLTQHGGSARLELSAFPSPRLLFGEGASLKVRASGIATGPVDPNSTATLGDLDGFGSVDVQVIGMRTGPLTISRLTLRRDGEQPYRATVQATVTGADLSAYAGQQLGGGLGGFLGGMAGGMMPGSGAPIPIGFEALLASDGGRARAVALSGSVAGLPAGPLVEALAAALAGRF